MQTTHHSKKSGMYEKAVKGDVTINMTEHKRITWETEATKRYHADTGNTCENVGARQYKGLDGTTPMMSDAITANSDPVTTILRDVRNEVDIVTYRGGKSGLHTTMAWTELLMGD